MQAISCVINFIKFVKPFACFNSLFPNANIYPTTLGSLAFSSPVIIVWRPCSVLFKVRYKRPFTVIIWLPWRNYASTPICIGRLASVPETHESNLKQPNWNNICINYWNTLNMFVVALEYSPSDSIRKIPTKTSS